MALGQKIIPYKGIDLDSHELNIDEMKAVFIRNLSYLAGDNNRISQDEGSNAYNFSPIEALVKYSLIPLPAGTNKCVGFHYAPEVNQAYIFGHNSNGDHFIYRIKGDDGTSEMILISPCLNFQNEPSNYIAKGRATHQLACRFNKNTGKEETVIYLIFTDNFNPQRFIPVDDVIATNGFDPVSFPYFNVNNADCYRCDWFNLGVPTPMGCVTVTPVQRNMEDEIEKTKSNLLNNKGWQFRIREVDQWGRASEHGIMSDVYFNQIGNSCINNSSGLPRCLRLRFPAGCAIVNQIQISYRNCLGDVKGQSLTSDWSKYTLINKYDDCDNKNWYERVITNPWQIEYNLQIIAGKTAQEASDIAYSKNLLRYYPVDNTFEYTFCADKECTPISVTETNRNENPLALTSGSIFPLNKSIATARNKKGFEPMSCGELNKVEFSTELPISSACTNVKLRKIEIWGIFYNPNVFGTTYLRYKNSQVIFSAADCSNNNGIAFGQVLPKDQEGIVGHLKGTEYYTISKQYKYNTITGDISYAGLNFFTPGGLVYLPVQKWEFNVLPGKYRFHLSSHKDSPSDNYKNSSTNFIGRTLLSNPGELIEEQREVIIDVCTDDYLLKDTPIMIWDLTNVGKNCLTSSNAASVVTGYLFEDDTEKNPIEMARVLTNQDGDVNKCNYTDHNGYYFATRQGRVLQAYLYGYKNCLANQMLALTRQTGDTEERWHRYDELYAYKKENLQTYPTKDRMVITGKVVLCSNSNTGIPGVLVNLTRAGYAITDVNGEYRIVMHDIGNMGARTEQLIIGQRSNCQILACQNDCLYCFPNIPVNSITCIGTDRVITVANVTARVNLSNTKGPKMRGRYGIGQFLYDWMGRRSFVQATEKHYLDIPSFQETKVYDFSKIKFNLNGAVYPSWVRKITFAITDNLNWDNDLTWVAERVQFIDNTGGTNTSAPTQIRLYYEGLNEYNKQYNFSTNSTWQFLTDGDATVQGDLIEFLANSDGVPYSKQITALAKYNQAGKYIQIDYSDELKDLKDGTLIKLIRLKNCVDKEFYYEVCPSIRVVNNQAVVQSGYINFWDSYMLSRQIPVPVVVKGTTTNDAGDVIETDVSLNKITPYPFFFEHHSPADTWGAYCRNRGRVGVKNPYEKERCLKTGIDVSNALVNDGLLNGLHYFEEKDSIELDEQEWGGINICIPEINTILAICEHDNFVITYNDNAVTVDGSGNVVAPSGERRFGRPERKIGNNFGCQLEDINTIRSKDGIVMFLDSSKSALVAHNYADAVDITPVAEGKGGYKSYISAVVKHIMDWNSQHPENKKYAHAVIDPKINAYLLTVANVNMNVNDYVINEPTWNPDKNDTIAIDIYSRVLYLFHSFVPEYYGSMSGDKFDQQLLSFRLGEAWRHHELNNPGSNFNIVYGQEVDKVMEVVYNTDNTKVKNYLWNEVYCREHQFYIDRIITEAGQLSRLMPKWWEKRDGFWSADFKCAINTQADVNLVKETGVNNLLDGDMLYGRWMRVRYIGVQSARTKYCELTAMIGFMQASEKSGLK